MTHKNEKTDFFVVRVMDKAMAVFFAFLKGKTMFPCLVVFNNFRRSDRGFNSVTDLIDPLSSQDVERIDM